MKVKSGFPFLILHLQPNIRPSINPCFLSHTHHRNRPNRIFSLLTSPFIAFDVFLASQSCVFLFRRRSNKRVHSLHRRFSHLAFSLRLASFRYPTSPPNIQPRAHGVGVRIPAASSILSHGFPQLAGVFVFTHGAGTASERTIGTGLSLVNVGTLTLVLVVVVPLH